LNAEVSAPVDSPVEVEPSHEFIQERADTSTIEREKGSEIESEKTRDGMKKQEAQQKDLTKDSTSTASAPKALVKKSSRFFSASFFSSDKDGTGFTLSSVFRGLAKFLRVHAPKVVFGVLFLGIG
jgi:hypothetical protein